MQPLFIFVCTTTIGYYAQLIIGVIKKRHLIVNYLRKGAC